MCLVWGHAGRLTFGFLHHLWFMFLSWLMLSSLVTHLLIPQQKISLLLVCFFLFCLFVYAEKISDVSVSLLKYEEWYCTKIWDNNRKSQICAKCSLASCNFFKWGPLTISTHTSEASNTCMPFLRIPEM